MQYAEKVPELYKLIVSLSSVLLTILPAISRNQTQAVLLFQITIIILFLNIVLGSVALYGRIIVPHNAVQKMLRAKEGRSYLAAIEKIKKEPVMLQNKVYSWSSKLCFSCFLSSQVTLSWYAILTA